VPQVPQWHDASVLVGNFLLKCLERCNDTQMKRCNITQAACQPVVCGTTWLQAACKLLGYRTHLS